LARQLSGRARLFPSLLVARSTPSSGSGVVSVRKLSEINGHIRIKTAASQ
jgi:hypothetical protein